MVAVRHEMNAVLLQEFLEADFSPFDENMQIDDGSLKFAGRFSYGIVTRSMVRPKGPSVPLPYRSGSQGMVYDEDTMSVSCISDGIQSGFF